MELNELMVTLLVWIRAHTNYTIPQGLPAIKFVGQLEIREMVVGQRGLEEVDEEFHATYTHHNRTISLDREIRPDFTRKKYQAMLLHELVHFVQYNIKPLPRCLNRLEPEAYRLTNAWLVEQGLPPAYSAETIWARGLCPEDVADIDLTQ